MVARGVRARGKEFGSCHCRGPRRQLVSVHTNAASAAVLPSCPVAQLLGRVSHVASTETVHPAGQFLSTRRPPAPPSPPCGPACKALGPLIMGPLRATAGVRRRRASQSPALARWRRSPPPHQRQRRTPCPCNAARHLEKIPAKHKEASVAIRARVHAMSHRVSSSRVKA